VGFVSADFRDKATMYLSLQHFRLFRAHNLTTVAYSSMEGQGPWREAVRSSVDRFVDTRRLSSDELQRQIAADAIDVLVNMDGYSNSGFRDERIFASRLAPVTASWFVYAGTSGSSNIDYIITDRVTVPMDHAAWYSEKLIYLPVSAFPSSHGAHFPASFGQPQGPQAAALERQRHGLPAGAFVMASFNNLLKLDPELFTVWLKLLDRIPGSVLWLLRTPREAEDSLRWHAMRAGADLDRLVFSDFLPSPAEHFLRVRLADVVLDTTVYGAHTGAVDAVWAGVPLVTCAGPGCVGPGLPPSAGEGMAARVGASLLTAAGCPELIAADLDGYAALVERLAAEAAFAADVRRKLQTAGRAALGDAHRYVERFVRGLHLAFENWLAGNAPRHLWVAPASGSPPPTG